MSAKRYYWLKLNESFFEDDTIAWLEEQENGKDYVIFYLKLALKSLQNDGHLIRYVGEKLMPYDVKALSKVTNTPLDTVAVAMKAFSEIGLVTILETGEIYLTQINEMVGSETDSAKRVRKHRIRNQPEDVKALQCNIDVTKCNTEIEIEKDIEKDIEQKATKKPTRHKHGEYGNILLTDEQYQKLKTEYSSIDDTIKSMDEWIQLKGKPYKDYNLALRKWINKDNIKPTDEPKREYRVLK